jgi:MoxR-like ATPase
MSVLRPPTTPSLFDETSPVKSFWDYVEKLLTLPMIRSLYIYGPPGVGKTFSAYTIGVGERPLCPITLTEDTASAELRGHYLALGREMVWHDGPVTKAMREGGRLVVNEVTHGTSDVFSLLHPVLENPDTACMTLPNNELVRPAEGFQCICTDNLPPEDLPLALRDRFDAVLEIKEPHPKALELLDARLREAARRTFALEADRRISLRGWLAIQKLQGPLGLKLACVAVLGQTRGQQVHDAILLAESRL